MLSGITSRIGGWRVRRWRQRAISQWCALAFGKEHASSIPQRGIRLFEEASEATQAAGVSREMAHQMVDHVWDRPVGQLKQEIGGVGITLLTLADAAGLDADECESDEAARVLSKPLEHFRRRNAEKNAAGFDLTSIPGPPCV